MKLHVARTNCSCLFYLELRGCCLMPSFPFVDPGSHVVIRWSRCRKKKRNMFSALLHAHTPPSLNSTCSCLRAPFLILPVLDGQLYYHFCPPVEVEPSAYLWPRLAHPSPSGSGSGSGNSRGFVFFPRLVFGVGTCQGVVPLLLLVRLGSVFITKFKS